MRVFMLLFPSLCLQLPFRLHLAVQTIDLALLAAFGAGPFSRSEVRKGWGVMKPA